MSLDSWSEPSMMRNIRHLDPFQRGRQMTLAQAAHAIRFHNAIGAAIVRHARGFDTEAA